MQVLAYDYTSVLGMSIGMMTATDTLQFTAISPQKLYSVARQGISTCHHELCRMAEHGDLKAIEKKPSSQIRHRLLMRDALDHSRKQWADRQIGCFFGQWIHRQTVGHDDLGKIRGIQFFYR